MTDKKLITAKVDYYGHDHDARTCDALGLKIDPTHREGEADLVHSRWFDYGRLHPVKATYLFAHHYKEQTRKFYETYIDIRTAEDARAFSPDDVFYSRELTSMWLARREADRLGLPYDFVMETAQRRFIDKLFHRFPRPNQLYSEEFVLDLNDAWRERLNTSLQWARDPYFREQNWRGDLLQARHAMFVIEQIQRRPAPHAGLLARMFKERVLAPAMVASRFSEGEVERARAMALSLGG